MTDNEIIQEATEAIEKNLNAGCYVGDLLRIVKEQQAEIEKLNVELVGMRGACESYKIHYDNAQAEIETLQKENEELGKVIGNAYELNCFLESTRKCVRTEAYREFALELKCGVPQETGVIRCADVDDTLKKLLSNDMGRYDHYTDSFVKEPTESNE